MSGDLSPPIELDSPLQRRNVSQDRPKGRWAGRATLVLVVLVGLTLASRSLMNQAPLPPAPTPPPAPEVTVSLPLKQKIASWTGFTGQFSAVDRVELRAQVGGYLTEIDFTDGQIVKKGDLLFRIDPRPYEIALQQARAGLQTAQAALELANQQLARTTELKQSSYASIETFDQRVQQQRGALGGVGAGQGERQRGRSSTSSSRASPPRSPAASAPTACRSATSSAAASPAARPRCSPPSCRSTRSTSTST